VLESQPFQCVPVLVKKARDWVPCSTRTAIRHRWRSTCSAHCSQRNDSGSVVLLMSALQCSVRSTSSRRSVSVTAAAACAAASPPSPRPLPSSITLRPFTCRVAVGIKMVQ